MSGIRTAQKALAMISILSTVVILPSCGSGSGGGGSGTGGTAPYEQGIVLQSITFPKNTDLTGGEVDSKYSTPLTQQVVFTFSGAVEGYVDTNSIQIYATPDSSYSGPKILLDNTKNRIVSRGTYEVIHNKIVFTPFIPSEPIDLSLYAAEPGIPGLLPGMTYSVYVPLGTMGSIANLVAVDKSVKNPEHFTTASFKSFYFNFGNHPQDPPRVTQANPANGTIDFPINTFSHIPGFPIYNGISLAFDQPLDFRYDNLEGIDYNNDKVREQNLFLKYTGPEAYTLVKVGASEPTRLVRIDRSANSAEVLGFTRFQGEDVEIKSIVFLDAGHLVGSSGTALYDMELAATGECALSNERSLPVRAIGLAVMGGLDLYAIDTLHHALVRIDAASGAVTQLGLLDSGAGEFIDLAVGFDDELYGLRSLNPGTKTAEGSIERIDTRTATSIPLVSGINGDFIGLGFSHSNTVALLNGDSKSLLSIDLADPQPQAAGEKITGLQPDGLLAAFSLRQYELGVTPVLVSNHYKQSEVRIEPSGILPIGAWIDIMVRNAFTNISGGNRVTHDGLHPLGAISVSCFKTLDPGMTVVEDFYEESFTDNDMEDRFHELANASALWNVQDTDGKFPQYSGLLASIGLSGAGELGNFEPTGLAPTIFLDTNYQPLPLVDGSTPNISVPTVVTNGEFHFKDITIPYGVTIMAQGSNPLVFTATGSVIIQGTIDVSGSDGQRDVTFNSAYIPTPGGVGGPGGGRGGDGQPAYPPDFKSLTQLQAVPRGERGWGPGNKDQIGGQGGESGAKGADVPWVGSLQIAGVNAQDVGSRGAGAGGGSFMQEGGEGYPGWGKYGVDDYGNFKERDPWSFWDGAYEYDESWVVGSSLADQPRLNEFPATAQYMPENQAPHQGLPGDRVFKDKDEQGEDYEANDFVGTNGEIQVFHGGQGGGGGGSRLNSMNPDALVQAAPLGLAASAFDAKGGGGGGGGGAFAIHSLGTITVGITGRILATGGRGGGGEVIGHSNFGGCGGGGSGGGILLNSAVGILLDYSPANEDLCAKLDVSGGFGADARASVLTARSVNDYSFQWCWSEVPETCALTNAGSLVYESKGFCTWSRGDGGYGGYGLIQLMVPDPESDLKMKMTSIRATVCEVDVNPNFEKIAIQVDHDSEQYDTYAFYSYDQGVDPISGNPIAVFPVTEKCLADPYKTLSTISPVTYGVTRWIDMGRICDRSILSGRIAPVFHGDDPDAFFGFRGVELGKLDQNDLELEWAVVKRSPLGDVPGQDNDIDVDSPDLYRTDFIDPSNNVAIQFQGTRARLPGSKVPDPDAASDWTPQLSSLEGYPFIRFRVGLNVADNGAVIHHASYKPQVNRVRIRFAY
ncbi:MAG: hypothetical protein ABIK28_01660 [Planctomycetota bacterium]